MELELLEGNKVAEHIPVVDSKPAEEGTEEDIEGDIEEDKPLVADFHMDNHQQGKPRLADHGRKPLHKICYYSRVFQKSEQINARNPAHAQNASSPDKSRSVPRQVFGADPEG